MDWYPHHIDDYDADTLHLTLAEDGAYARLLRWYYKNERPLPNDDVALAAICRIGIDEWKAMADKIRALFVTRDKRDGSASALHQKRCDRVILGQNKKRRDGKARQERLRKNNILTDVTRDTRVSNAPRGEERRGESLSTESNDSVDSSSPKTGDDGPEIPGDLLNAPVPNLANRMMEIWNDTAGEAGARSCNIDAANEARCADLRRRFKDTFAKSWDQWLAFCQRVAASDFLCARLQARGHSKTPFQISVDWAIKPKNLTKIMEGNYDNRRRDGSSEIGRRMGLE